MISREPGQGRNTAALRGPSHVRWFIVAMKNDEYFMKKALECALEAADMDEVPVGAVIVKNNKIIAKAGNRREKDNLVTSHAEILAITKANKKLKSWRLNDCALYVTLEPCIMCAGAIIQARFSKVVFGAYDLKGGAFGSSINVLDSNNLNWKPLVIPGVLQVECSSLLSDYFKNKREEK